MKILPDPEVERLIRKATLSWVICEAIVACLGAFVLALGLYFGRRWICSVMEWIKNFLT